MPGRGCWGSWYVRYTSNPNSLARVSSFALGGAQGGSPLSAGVTGSYSQIA